MNAPRASFGRPNATPAAASTAARPGKIDLMQRGGQFESARCTLNGMVGSQVGSESGTRRQPRWGVVGIRTQAAGCHLTGRSSAAHRPTRRGTDERLAMSLKRSGRRSAWRIYACVWACVWSSASLIVRMIPAIAGRNPDVNEQAGRPHISRRRQSPTRFVSCSSIVRIRHGCRCCQRAGTL